MRQIPKNKIKENQYTNGTGIGNNLSLRFSISKVPYIGFYNIVNGNKFFTGKMYNTESKSLEKYNIVQTAFSLIATAGSIATTINPLFTEQTTPVNTRYFYKELNTTLINIKEINQQAFNKLSTGANMNYQVVSYNPAKQTIEDVNKEMPGLLTFLAT